MLETMLLPIATKESLEQSKTETSKKQLSEILSAVFETFPGFLAIHP